MEEGSNLIFHNYNKVIDGTAIKRLISRLIDHFGMGYTSHILDQIKTLGFQQATATSISLGIDDLFTIPSKGWLVQDAQEQSLFVEKHNYVGNIHAVEKLRQSIEIWYATSEYLRQEMNPNFRIIDPVNPVHIMSFSGARGTASQVHQLVGMRGLMTDPQGQMIDLAIQSNLREGLSITEYIISCYGARKGVVDTAVRTSDAGYLTRRLVEVVQHVVIRRTDCGTTRGISVSPRTLPERSFIQTLLGRVLADDIYIGPRCIAIRNQDIGIGLVNQFLSFRAQLLAISIRTPFTCRSSSWICRLCYGRSPAHGDLVELGEAVGIIAGQSIGEPGTQLTLRTFHTGGVFTGRTAEYVRAPSNGKIQFNEDLVHPTRTRHGQPAFLCSIDLSVSIESEDIIHKVTIPAKSFLLVQTDQYVKSEQVIAEIRAGTHSLNLKERVRKHIYSDSEGEMHWSTHVYHSPEVRYNNVHLLPKPSHLWILVGGSYKFSLVPFSLHKDQDQLNVDSPSPKQRANSGLSVNNDNVRPDRFSSDFSDQKEGRISYSCELIGTEQPNCIYFPIFDENSDLLGKRRKNRLLIPFHSLQDREKELMPHSRISIKIPRNGIYLRNSILSFFDDPQYKRTSSGITKYETLGVHSIVKKEDGIEYPGVPKLNPKYQIEVDRFFFIPEEVYILPESSSLMVRNNSIIGVDTQITLNRRTRVGGLVRVERKNKSIEIEIFSGDIHFPLEIDKISQHSGIFIPPGTENKNGKESKKPKNWMYVQPITLTKKKKKKSFVLFRTLTTYEIADGINLATLFPRDLFQEKDNMQLQVVNYIRYRNGKRSISHTSQLVRTCLVLNWDQDQKSSCRQDVHASLIEISTNGLIRDFLRLDLVKSPILYRRKRNDLSPSGAGLIYDNGSYRTNQNPFYSKARVQQSFRQNHGTIRTFLNRNKESQSLIILSSANCFHVGPFNDGKEKNIIKQSMKKEPLIPLLGPFGTAHPVEMSTFYPAFYPVISLPYNHTLVQGYLQLKKLRRPFQALPYFLMDENSGFYNLDLDRIIVLNPFHLNWYFPHSNYCDETSTKISLGQLISEHGCIAKKGPYFKSGQVLIVQVDSVVIRSAKPFLATPGARVHGHYGELIYEGEAFVTFLYEKLRSSDITQGLPKVEKVVEVRSIDSISMSLENRIEGWNKRITRILGIPWSFLIGAELTIVQSRIALVNKIQKIYRSQGVHIDNRHIELIVRQITAKVLISKDKISNVFLPGELIGLLRAERTARALEEAICYRAILLGITRASLNTQSFISEASFQETARVLAKAALRGRIDWLKGLKENVVLGGMIPAGTGFKGLIHCSRRDNNSLLEKKKKKLFGGEKRNTFFHHRELVDSCRSKKLHDPSDRPFL